MSVNTTAIMHLEILSEKVGHFVASLLKQIIVHHDMGTLSVLLALCEGNPQVTGGFPSKRACHAGFDII